MAPLKLWLLAGEASGDRLGAAFMEGLAELSPETRVEGVGGPAMAARGLDSLFPMDDLSVMGLAEVVPRYPTLRRRLGEAARAAIASDADALITIDSPDFSLRLARMVKAARPGIRTIHYVAPSVWAWRAGRAAKMSRHVEHVLALLPFEPPLMEAAGMDCDFVGHPVVTEQRATDTEVAAFRRRSGIGEAPLLLVLPGSRLNEVDRLMPVFGDALREVAKRVDGVRVVVPTLASLAERVQGSVSRWPGDPVVINPLRDPLGAQKRAAFAAADVALAASGTVSLELARARTPMVIAYDLNWLSWQIMSRLAKVDTVTLVNLLAERKAVPEFLGPACRPAPIGAELSRLLGEGAARLDQITAMDEAMAALGEGGEPPGRRAAKAVLRGLGRSV